MTLYEAIELCGNSYNQYIQIGWAGGRHSGKQSGIMKKGNLTYEKMDKYGYGYEVRHIFACFKQNKNVLFIHMWSKKE